MDEKKIHKIKDAVKRNFEQSPDKYSIFENKYGFFSILNSNLVDRMKILSNARILDIGCGTGASARQILQTIPDVGQSSNVPVQQEVQMRAFSQRLRMDCSLKVDAKLFSWFHCHRLYS